jgi:two-component system, OmpR family, sensor histidine kinase KdpD
MAQGNEGSRQGRSLVGNEYVQSFGIVALATALGILLRPYLQVTDLAMLLLLAVVVVAYRHRRGPAVLASLLSIAAFDFWFVPPYHTFAVHDTAYLLTFGVMLIVALVMSQLTARIREQVEEARERERRTAALFALSRELAGAPNLVAQTGVLERHAGQVGNGQASVILDRPHGGTQSERRLDESGFESVAVRVAAAWAYEHGESAGWGTSQCAEADALVLPLNGSSRTLGVLVLRPRSSDEPVSTADRRTLEALAGHAAAAFERTMLAESHEQARVEVESERLRTALLSSLSHDLRTPLGSIEGAASSLLEDSGAIPGTIQREMAETIIEESRRMNRLVTNLLDMVRVESGALAVQKSWQPLEEALGVALLRLEERLAGRKVETRLPADLPLVPIDELLIEQVFINLLENAAKHTPPGTPITVSAWAADGVVTVEVADRGAGVSSGEEETIFRKFYRGARTDELSPAGGSGLGLTICRGIVTAHGGRIWLHSRASPGAAFRFTLPLEGPPLSTLPEQVLEGSG